MSSSTPALVARHRSALTAALAFGTLVAACSSTRGGGDDGGAARPVVTFVPVDVPDASPGDGDAEPPACKPRCAGKQCGSDGCGGSCGRCGAGETCDARTGQCARPACVPDCGRKTCGFDGCGGSCGSCAVGACSAAGQCECRADVDCGTGARCGYDPAGKRVCVAVCDPFAPVTTCPLGQACDDLGVESFTGHVDAVCGAYGTQRESESCVPASGVAFGHDCAPGLLCAQTTTAGALACVRFCDSQHTCPKPGQQCIAVTMVGKATPYQTCNPPMGACQPNPCRDVHRTVCAPSASANSGYTCACDAGYVDVNGQCKIPCTPRCSGKTCGDDGCGGTCGSCASPATCTATGACCAAQCAGRECGDDGCGGTCGACASGSQCTPAARCEVCVPQCNGKSCGSDGCGGTCGSCGFGQSCSSLGQCTCTPRCGGKTCGDDGCGGTCGACPSGSSCSQGACLECDPVSNTGCGFGEGCWALSSGTTACSVTGTGRQGAACTSTNGCAGGYGCFARVCRKICDVATGSGCSSGTCTGVSGWTRFGACQ